MNRVTRRASALLLLVLVLAPVAAAANTSGLNRNIASGTCGEGISWSLDGYTLTVTLTAECEEEIGESVPIYTEDTRE